MSIETHPEKISRLDAAIKTLVVLKLLVQLAFYGVLLGAALWFLLENPIPGLLEKVQADLMSAYR